MAENVVVRNPEGEDIVYEDVSGVELPSENGGTATFIHDAEIKQADWAQTDGTQKDYIKNKPNLAPAATEGTYASLKEKPFGDIPVVLEETELPFEEDKQYNIYVAVFVAEDEPVPGETYKVIWDGTEYLCVCHNEKIHENIDMGIIPYWFGNQTLFWNMGLGENSGEPFCIWRGNTVDGGFAIETLDTDAAHTVSIVPVNTVKKLDKKYLPDDIGGGSVSTEKVIEYDFAVSGVPAVKFDNELMEMSLYKVSDETPSLEELQGAVMVQNYVPGSLEDCVATVNVAEAMVANEEIFMSSQYNATSEGSYAFFISYVTGEVTANIQGVDVTVDIPEPGIYVLFDMGNDPPANWKFSLTYNEKLQTLPEVTESDNGKVLGVVAGTWGKIDLPEGNGATSEGLPEDFLSEQEMLVEITPSIDAGFGYIAECGAYAYAVNFGETIAKFPCTVGDECVVVWDSIQYEVTVIDPSSVMPEAIGCIGNGVNFGLPGNGEPFVICWDENGVMFISLTDTEALGHTVAIYQKKTIEKIDKKYLPDIPEFDLVAMGLPNIPADGTKVSAECDVTEMQEAMAKGLVKIKANVQVNSDLVFPLEAVFTPLFDALSNTYSLSGIASFAGTLMVAVFQIYSGKIDAQIYILATATA